MRLLNRKRRERRGFTLIELLVVIGIIGILAALTAAAILPLLGKQGEVQTVNDIRQLSAALESFKTKYGRYPPSRIRLVESGKYNTQLGQGLVPVNPLDFDSYDFLSKCWPNIQFPIDWNGDGKVDGDWTLQGHQCLVFFLGGLQQVPAAPPIVGEPVTGTCLGFNTDPRNPGFSTDPRNPTKFANPLFVFDSSRLILPVSSYPPGYPPSWPSGLNWIGLAYRDNFGTITHAPLTPTTPSGVSLPDVMYYAYFSSYNRPNGYNKYGTTLSDCVSLGLAGVWPYIQTAATGSVPARYYNPNTFQIISAGRDGIFGAGGLGPHPPGVGVGNNSSVPDMAWRNPFVDQGADDFSNFATGALGGGL